MNVNDHIRFFKTLLLFLIVVAGGCSDGPHANYGDLGLVDVSGTITLDGQPLADAVVTFEDPESGQFSYGQTDADGYYELQLDSEMEGVVPGRKIVRISTSRTILGLNSDSEGPPGEGGEEGGDGGTAAERVPEKYYQKSELTAEVSADATEFNFDLQSG